jgi:hypothetical protein
MTISNGWLVEASLVGALTIANCFGFRFVVTPFECGVRSAEFPNAECGMRNAELCGISNAECGVGNFPMRSAHWK